MQNKNLVNYLQDTHALLLNQDRQERKASLLQRIETNGNSVGVIFAGQGFDY